MITFLLTLIRHFLDFFLLIVRSREKERVTNSQLHLLDTNECEHVLITHILASRVACGLRRLPAGFHVIVEVDGNITRTPNEHLLAGEDRVEWDNLEILLPSNTTSSISFSVYASFEHGPRLGNGELVSQFKINAGEVLDLNEPLQPIDFAVPKDDVLPSCSSLRIMPERRFCEMNESCPRHDVPESDATNALAELTELTDEGHRALVRYQRLQDHVDLDAAIRAFERVQEICPLDHSNRAAVLSNLANAKFIKCQARAQHQNLDVPIGLYREALRLRSDDHPDYCTAALGLSFVLLSRFQRRGNEVDMEEVMDLLTGVVEFLAVDCYAYRAVLLALRMVETSLSMQAADTGLSQAEEETLDGEIQRSQDRLHNMSSRNPRRPAVLASLGMLLYERFGQNGDLADINEAILMLENTVNLTCNSHPDFPSRLNSLGNALFLRFESLGDLMDIHKSITMLEGAVSLTPGGHPDRPDLLSNLGNSVLRRFQCIGELVDVHRAISLGEEAVSLTSDGDYDKMARLSNLGSSLLTRFERLGSLDDINRSILMIQQALCLTSETHPYKPALLNNLGNSLSRRFKRLGNIEDIHGSISMFEQAICLTPDGHPVRLALLNNLGQSLFSRFQSLGDLADIHKSISMEEEAVCLTPDNHPNKPAWLSSLGNSLLYRFEHLGDLADISRSILIFEKAISLTPDVHPEKPTWLNNLGSSLFRRFERFDDLADLNNSISILEKALDLTPEDHPDRVAWLFSLGNSLSRRFERLGDSMDINRSTLINEQVVNLTPDGHPIKPLRLNNLGNSLLRRFERFGDVADINKSISMLEAAVGGVPDGHPDKPTLLQNLGNSLSSRFKRLGDLADVNRSILVNEEAVHLTLDSHPGMPARLSNLGNSLLARLERLGDPADIDRSISVGEDAVRLTADDHPDKVSRLNNLGISLFRRFEYLGDLTDIDRAILMEDKAVHLTPDGHPDKPPLLNNLGSSLMTRFEHLGTLSDIDRSLSLKEDAVLLVPNGHPGKPMYLSNLANSLLTRFDRIGELADVDRSILVGEDAVSLTPDGHPDKPARLNSLGSSLFRRFERLGSLADIEKAMSMKEESIRLTPDGHPDKPFLLNNLGSSLFHRFVRLGDLGDVVKSISMQEEALSSIPDGHPNKPLLSRNLGDAFMSRFQHSHDSSDLTAAAFHFASASRASAGSASNRFYAARGWISFARLQENSSVLLDANAAAINLLPQLAWIGHPLVERHRLLVEAADVARDAAAAAVEAGCPELAVEQLEQGRSIVWAQFLQLRDPVDELQIDHPALAHQFQHISRELEHISSRNQLILDGNLTTHTRSLEVEVQRHHGLATRRDKLLCEIRFLPGFDRFLLPKTIKQLSGLANSGPVIYLNASKHRCDALVVRAGLEKVVNISFPDISYEDLVLMQCLLLKRNFSVSREEILAFMPSKDPIVPQNCLDAFFKDCIEDYNREGTPRIERYSSEDRLQWILAFLWKRVVRPVLEVLGFLTSPSGTGQITHIFWCPTGPFSFLPIHAAGLYGAAHMGEKLSDFVISSYIPTLSALTPSAQNASNDLPSVIRLLLISQPPDDGQMKLPCVGEEIDYIKSLLAKCGPVLMQDSNGVVEDVMEKMENADWVHFACHGVQDLNNPLESGLCLANHRRLTLSDIIRLSRPQGGIAFLSACQTARGDEKLSEESVHLAAGMLLAGYSSVIATMWSIMDHDAPKVTREVYEHLFRDRKVPNSMETAEALHLAVRRLRDSGVPFSSWVPFIHVGR